MNCSLHVLRTLQDSEPIAHTVGSTDRLVAVPHPVPGRSVELCAPHLQPIVQKGDSTCVIRLPQRALRTKEGNDKGTVNPVALSPFAQGSHLNGMYAVRIAPESGTSTRSPLQAVQMAETSIGSVIDLQIYSQGRSCDMSRNPDPDESIVLDFGLFRRALIRQLRADNVISAEDVAVVRAFDEPFRVLSTRTKARKAFDSLMRNGKTRHSDGLAKDAGIMVIVGGDQQVADVIYIGCDPFTPEAA